MKSLAHVFAPLLGLFGVAILFAELALGATFFRRTP